ncbi:MAG: NUDIX domain-containing protein [Alphaproteobacteria bacterium]|nr:NUDIX domain-containing protein [Alphaproteobacteria bacterium]
MSDDKKPASPLASATILLLRDGAHGIEVFMVKRHHQIDFASGALVFPGGKVDPHDRDPALRNHTDGAEKLDDLHLSLRACAIREGFEESGIILARKPGTGDYIDAAASAKLAPWRPKLNASETGLVEFLSKENLRLACDTLVPFAHWVTPTFMPKRFDTYFYLAATPPGQLGRHDGSESVDSVWVNPIEAIGDKRWTIIFPTKMNLLRLGKAKTVTEAIAAAKSTPIVTVEPKVMPKGDGQVLTIPEEAGYGKVEEPMSSLRG